LLRLISIGSLAALFFSSTFVINRALSLEGGHWAWTSSLRFIFMLLMLLALLLFTQGRKTLAEVIFVFFKHWLFWVLAGSIGFGVFYSLITFSSEYAAGWIVATTWQSTLLISPLVLLCFGRIVPRNGLFFTIVIFIGIVLVNLEYAMVTSIRDVLFSALPIIIAAFAYPIGNQMVWESRKGEHPRLPHIDHPILDNAFARVLLLTVGSLPFWIVLLIVTDPPAPSSSQILSTALVALLSGVIATTLFLYARHLAQKPYEVSAVDSTQSLEVIFTLFGEILLLGVALPGRIGSIGIILTVLGLIAYISFQKVHIDTI
jgi:drug/metabolite transporter (DMT)-like permease